MCLRDFRAEPVANMAAEYTSIGKKAYAKDSTWSGSAQAEAGGWRRSSDDWAKTAAAGYKAASLACKDLPEAIFDEREADLEMLKMNGPPITALEENKAKLMFHTNQMLRNLTSYNSEPTVRRMIEAVP